MSSYFTILLYDARNQMLKLRFKGNIWVCVLWKKKKKKRHQYFEPKYKNIRIMLYYFIIIKVLRVSLPARICRYALTLVVRKSN